MRKMVFALVLMLGVSAFAEYPAAQSQLSLDEGQYMDDVVRLLGAPDATESSTCGTKTRKPWDCRIWRYRGEGKIFEAVFTLSQDGKRWYLRSWFSS